MEAVFQRTRVLLTLYLAGSLMTGAAMPTPMPEPETHAAAPTEPDTDEPATEPVYAAATTADLGLVPDPEQSLTLRGVTGTK